VIRDIGAGARIDHGAGFRPQARHVGVGHLSVRVLAFENLALCGWRQKSNAKGETEHDSAVTSHFVSPAAAFGIFETPC
jgi:hypothetical protein